MPSALPFRRLAPVVDTSRCPSSSHPLLAVICHPLARPPPGFSNAVARAAGHGPWRIRSPLAPSFPTRPVRHSSTTVRCGLQTSNALWSSGNLSQARRHEKLRIDVRPALPVVRLDIPSTVARTQLRSFRAGQRWRQNEDGGSSPKTPLRKKLLERITPHENIYTVPNILTFSRLIAAPFVGYFIATSQHTLALSLFFYAGVTDLIDGYIARRYSMQTVVGTVIDPMADKALMTISVVSLAMRNGIPWWLASLILLRDVGLGIAAIYYRWISLPSPKTMTRYWDFSLPSAEVKPTQISKYNTFLQLLLVGAGVALPVLPEAIVSQWGLANAFEYYQYLVALTTVWSGASYVYSKDAVKILTKEEVEERLQKGQKENLGRKTAQK